MPPVRIGVLVSGSGTNLQSIIDGVEAGCINGTVEVVISNKEDAFGLERARKHNINAVFINPKNYLDMEAYNESLLEVLSSYGVDLVVLAGYIKILSPKIIERYKNSIINIHPSLIPSFCGKGYYGLRVHKEAVSYGVKLSGATVHFVDENADTGPIIIQEPVAVDFEDTADSLQKKILKTEHKILPLAVKYFCERRLEVVGRKVKIKEIEG